MPKQFTVSDGKLMPILRPAGGGCYAVTPPLDPTLITQARSVEEAFVMAYDAQKCLKAARAERARQLSGAAVAQGRMMPTRTWRALASS